MKLTIMPGPAFWAAVAVRTKIPVPITAPMPSRVSWNAPSERFRDFFSAVAKIESIDLTRPRPGARGAAVAMVLPSELGFGSDRNGSNCGRNPLRALAYTGPASVAADDRRRCGGAGAAPFAPNWARCW